MSASASEIIKTLDSITNVTTDEYQVDKLASTVDQIAALDNQLLIVESLLRVFERFPEDDGFGVFGTILHRIESIAGYEPLLLASIRRTPSEFTLSMINRLINAGIMAIEGVDLTALLVNIEANTNYSERVRETARNFLEHQKSKALKRNNATKA